MIGTMQQFCPRCENSTYQVLIQYEPEPNGAQIEAEDIPTDELQLVAATLCCECGDLITATPAEYRRSVEPNSSQERDKKMSEHEQQQDGTEHEESDEEEMSIATADAMVPKTYDEICGETKEYSLRL